MRRLALRRLSYLTPANAGKVLWHDRYWTSAFVELLLERCHHRRLESAAEARSLIIHGPELVERIGVGDRPEQYRNAADLISAKVRVLSLLGDCERLLDAPAAAGEAFEQASRLAASTSKISLLAAADLHRQRAALAVEEGRVPHALELLHLATSILESSERSRLEHARSIAEVWLMIGALGARGLPDLAKAAAHARPRESGGDSVFDAALDLFDHRLDRHPAAPEVFERAGHWLKMARRQPFPRCDLTRRLNLTWAEGRVLAMLGIGRLAERRLLRVWKGWQERGEPLRLALATLDLVLLDVGRDDRRSAARRLEVALRGLPPAENRHDEVPELLRQARNATYTSLVVFRRRLSRRLQPSPTPRALLPRRRPPAASPWPLPVLLGAG